MPDKEKFEGFINKLIDKNENEYGRELREKYDLEAIDKSNQKLKNMSKKQYEYVQKLTLKVNESIKRAFEIGDPAGKTAQDACELHKEWIMIYWDTYSEESHMTLAQMYVDDERFKTYYDALKPGCAVFLRDAMRIYTSK